MNYIFCCMEKGHGRSERESSVRADTPDGTERVETTKHASIFIYILYIYCTYIHCCIYIYIYIYAMVYEQDLSWSTFCMWRRWTGRRAPVRGTAAVCYYQVRGKIHMLMSRWGPWQITISLAISQRKKSLFFLSFFLSSFPAAFRVVEWERRCRRQVAQPTERLGGGGGQRPRTFFFVLSAEEKLSRKVVSNNRSSWYKVIGLEPPKSFQVTENGRPVLS